MTPGTATAVPSPSDTLICDVPSHALYVAHNTSICLLAGHETGACIPAASTPGRSAVESSPSTEMGATFATGYSFPPSRLPARTHWSYPQASHHGSPGASLRRPVRALGHCSGPYRAAPKSVRHPRKAPSGLHSHR